MNRVKCIIRKLESIKEACGHDNSKIINRYLSMIRFTTSAIQSMNQTRYNLKNFEEDLDKELIYSVADVIHSIRGEVVPACTRVDVDTTELCVAKTLTDLYNALCDAVICLNNTYAYRCKKFVGCESVRYDLTYLTVVIDAAETLWNAIQEIFSFYENNVNRVYETVIKSWKDILTYQPSDGKWLKSFKLIVSVSQSNDFQLHNQEVGIIAASYITENHTALYKDGCMGFCYEINSKDLIGMSPWDCNSSVQLIRNADDWMLNEVCGKTKINKYEFLYMSSNKFKQCYGPQDLLQRGSEDFNEIILHGFSRPVALFVPVELIDSSIDSIAGASLLYQLPIVVFHNKCKAIRILDAVQSFDDVHTLEELKEITKQVSNYEAEEI